MKRVPWVRDEAVYFEISSGCLAVFEPGQDIARYKLPDCPPGIYRLPAHGIRKATKKDRKPTIVSVDVAQMFFVDDAFSSRFLELFDPDLLFKPADYRYLASLRRRLGLRFGYLVCGDVPSEEFTGDGSYVIDVGVIERVDSRNAVARPKPQKDPLLTILRKMKTFICNTCEGEDEELMSHPTVGYGTPEWFREMVAYARELGWTTCPGEGGWIPGFLLVGPRCAARLKEGECLRKVLP